MEIRIFKDYLELSIGTADFIAAQVKKKPKSLLCFPSGDSPTGTLKTLVQYALSGKVDFSQCNFVGLDEWVGMDKNTEGSCQHYMYTHFFDPAKIPSQNIIFFDAKASDLDRECKRIDQFILEQGGIDLILVGVGMNGHIGLNEPGVSPESYSHHVQLDEITKNVAQKYFTDSKKLSKGITLGLKHVMESKSAVVIANGARKAEIIQKIIEGPVTEQVPGSALQRHINCHFFLDPEAAAKISSTLRA